MPGAGKSIAPGRSKKWLNTAEVGSAVRELAGLAADPEAPLPAIQAAARRTGQLLLKPFEPRLRTLPEIDTLRIDADDMLSRVLWALVAFSSGESLIHRYSFSISAGSLARRHPPPLLPSARVAVFANPDPGRRRNDFPSLPDADAEGKMVAGLFHAVTMSRGEDATENALLHEAVGADVLHFAGHGIRNGGFGGLVMAGQPAFVTAEQISRMKLQNLKLVVLSACSTGVGLETETINPDTLIRGFLDAGAARVLASSWDVDSGATRELMHRFYAGVLRGLAPAAALRNAMLAMSATSAFAHPAFWAAFELYGEP